MLFCIALDSISRHPQSLTGDKDVAIANTRFMSVIGSDFTGAISVNNTNQNFCLTSSLFEFCFTQYYANLARQHSSSCFFLIANRVTINESCFINCFTSATSTYGFQASIYTASADSYCENNCFLGDGIHRRINAPFFQYVTNSRQNYSNFNLYELGGGMISLQDTSKTSINVYNVVSNVINIAYGTNLDRGHEYLISHVNYIKVSVTGNRGIVDYFTTLREFSYFNFYKCSGKLFSLWPGKSGEVDLSPAPVLSNCCTDTGSALLSWVTLSEGILLPERTNTHNCWPASFVFTRSKHRGFRGLVAETLFMLN